MFFLLIRFARVVLSAWFEEYTIVPGVTKKIKGKPIETTEILEKKEFPRRRDLTNQQLSRPSEIRKFLIFNDD